MPPPVLEFDDLTHTYRHNGKVVLSVTTALRDGGLIDARWYAEGGAIRGTFVHSAIAMQMRGVLDWGSLHPDLVPYVEAWNAFVADTGFVADLEWVERMILCEPYQYAGRIDAVGMLFARTLIEIKTGGKEAWHPYQTAAYAHAILLAGGGQCERKALYLSKAGRYSLASHTDPTDIVEFLDALQRAKAWNEAAVCN